MIDPSAFARAMHRIGDAGDRLAADLRHRGCMDAEVDAAVASLGVLMYAYLTQVWADVNHPRFMPGAGFYTHIGFPNPDTFYRTAAVDGSGTYRLTGERGTAPEVSLMPFGGPTATGLRTFPPRDLGGLQVGADGRFDVLLSAERPAGHQGDWWQIDPDVRSIMLRSVSADWGEHREPLVAIVRVDTPARRRQSAPEEVMPRLEALAAVVERALTNGLGKFDRLRADGVVNRLVTTDYSANGGLPGQWYFEGVFDLTDDVVLVMEVNLPLDARFSLSLTNLLFCTLDWTHAQSSLNHRQAQVDDDGMLRVVLAPSDPGVPNWLDTTGREMGALQCRFMGCDQVPEPLLRVIPRLEMRRHLPAATPAIGPAQRDEALRARSAAAQLRALW